MRSVVRKDVQPSTSLESYRFLTETPQIYWTHGICRSGLKLPNNGANRLTDVFPGDYAWLHAVFHMILHIIVQNHNSLFIILPHATSAHAIAIESMSC